MRATTQNRARWIPAVAGILALSACALAAPLHAQSGTRRAASRPRSSRPRLRSASCRRASSILKTGAQGPGPQAAAPAGLGGSSRARLDEPGAVSRRVGKRRTINFERPGKVVSMRLTRARPRGPLRVHAEDPDRRRDPLGLRPQIGPGRGSRSRLRVASAPRRSAGLRRLAGRAPGGGTGRWLRRFGRWLRRRGGGGGNVVPPPTPSPGRCPTPRTRPAATGRHALAARRAGSGLPAALAQRLLHRVRRRQRHRPTGEPLDQDSMPANTAGVHIDPAEINRNDGFSPGNMIIVRVPGLDNPQAFENTGAVGVDDMAATRTRTSRSWSSTPTPASDSRSGRRSTTTRSIRQGGRSQQRHGSRRRQPDHPPGGQLRGGRPLHRRPAEPEERERQHDPAHRCLPDLPRQPDHHGPRDRGPALPHGEPVRGSRRRRHRPLEPVPGLGLHGGERAQPLRADAPIRDDAFARSATRPRRRAGGWQRPPAVINLDSRRRT